jgi:predicted nucleotidyltransferase
MVPQQLPLTTLARRLATCLEAQGIVVDALYLFGSQARGEATPASDLDLLLVSPSFERQSFWSRCARVGEALGDFPAPVQVYPVTVEEFRHPEPGGFLEALRPDLRLLYRRGPRRAVQRRGPRLPGGTG